MDPKQPENAPSIGRRRALQLGAATAVGAATWAQPSLKGFARTPAYASEGSGVADFFVVEDPFAEPFPYMTSDPGTYVSWTTSESGTTLTVEISAVDSSGVPLTGCFCALTSAELLCDSPVPAGGTISGAIVGFDISSCSDAPVVMFLRGTCA